MIRKKIENNEKLIFSQYAAFSSDSKGRQKEELKCDIRTDYQRDCDRIIHSGSFRRLKHKTQVFLAPEGDHYRTRLTHTLEVAQIARTIARCLRLNEDLTEAIALGHDLGHTPFGHEGERVLNQIVEFGFTHREQSVRVVRLLENDGQGLNLTSEVLDGIRNHAGDDQAATLEGAAVKLADRIAYINHDIDDAVRAGVLQAGELPKEARQKLGNTHSDRIGTLIAAVAAESADKPYVRLPDDIAGAFDMLRQFMREHIYFDSAAKTEEKKVVRILTQLFEYYRSNVDELPAFLRGVADKEGVDRAVCDHIANMTDRYAVRKYMELFIPQNWQI